MSQAHQATLDDRHAVDDPAFQKIRRQITHPILFRLYLLAKLPLGLFAGLRVRSIDRGRCRVTLPYGWRTTNPFKSMYFAAQAMAAELSTGALGLAAVASAPASVAMLIVGLEAEFGKKADRRVTFTCADGAAIFAAVAETVRSGAPATATVETVGRMDDGTEVARFRFTWSFKKRAGG